MYKNNIVLKIFIILNICPYGHMKKYLPLNEELIKDMGRPYEVHTKQTTDGYTLTSYRIMPTENAARQSRVLPAVVMMHGGLSSSEDFVLMENKSIVFVMADAGYDVWLPNARYTEMAFHSNLSRSDDAYWDFSLDEIAMYDIPECIDYVLETSGTDRFIYIGLSMGNIFYVMMVNHRPDMADKTAAYVAFSPSYFSSVFQPAARTLRAFGIMKILEHTMFAGKKYHQHIGRDDWERANEMCDKRFTVNSCAVMLYIFAGLDLDEIDLNNTVSFKKNMYLSLREVDHQFQLIGDGVLARYDYGYDGNIQHYGTPIAPPYSWKVLKGNVIFYWGMNDRPLSQDFNKTLELMKLSKAKVNVRIPRWKYFNHIDYVSSRSVGNLLYLDLLKTLDTIL